jgi:hypothetical protein
MAKQMPATTMDKLLQKIKYGFKTKPFCAPRNNNAA